jgi:hypothetical protein
VYYPSPLTTSQSLIKLSLSYSYLTTGMAGLAVISRSERSKNMIVNVDHALIWILLAAFIGAVILIGFRYYSLYMRACKTKMKRGEDCPAWDKRSYVAIAADVILGVLLTYAVYRFANWIYTGEPFGAENLDAVLLISAAVGAGAAFIVDSWFPQAWLNGELDKAWVAAQEKVKEVLASEEARNAALEALASKAKALGVVDAEKVDLFCEIVEDSGKDDLATMQNVATLVNGNDAETLKAFLKKE